ncbi:MAG: peptidoglycan DD-metalloendopeptidase family protein [Propionibacteriaceae bacterium]|nr:peptidoglycan DD-metalloendopeptidase family protein [Propionibacteriaceae bacterium]
MAQRKPTSHRLAGLRALAIGLLTIALLGVSSLAAHADDLGSQESAKQDQIAANAVTIQKNQDALTQAANALKASQSALATAKSDLATKQQAATDAKAEDDTMAANLAVAEQALADRQADLAVAQQAVTDGLNAIAAQRDQIGLIAQTTAQQNTTLLALAMLLNGGFDTASLNNQVQWATTVFTANEDAMERLQTAQIQLQAAQDAAQKAKDAADAAEAEVATQKAATAAHLTLTQQAQADADAAAKTVAAKVSANQQAETDAAAALKQSQDEQAQYEADLAKIQQQIQAQMAQDQAQGIPNQAAPSSGTFFQRPVPGPVTATFGWRIPPIAGASSYHQGVDFGSPCGTPILASAAGTVTYAGWNGSLGNYVAINHGLIAGNYYSTGYGHQSKIAVSVGQQVARAQVIGYVGTTGVSTGCHVHYNVYKNGTLINGLPLVS